MHLVDIIDGPHVHGYALGMHRLHKPTVHNQDSDPPYRHLGSGRTAAAPGQTQASKTCIGRFSTRHRGAHTR